MALAPAAIALAAEAMALAPEAMALAAEAMAVAREAMSVSFAGVASSAAQPQASMRGLGEVPGLAPSFGLGRSAIGASRLSLPPLRHRG